jgi:hypothetical protein
MNLFPQQFVLMVHPLVETVQMRMLPMDAQTEGKCAGGRHALVVEDLLLVPHLPALLHLVPHLPALLHLVPRLPRVDVQLVPLDLAVNAAVLALTVESQQIEAALSSFLSKGSGDIFSSLQWDDEDFRDFR